MQTLTRYEQKLPMVLSQLPDRIPSLERDEIIVKKSAEKTRVFVIVVRVYLVITVLLNGIVTLITGSFIGIVILIG